MSLLRRHIRIDFPSRRLIRERWRTRTATINPEPLFVFGNQKSGTTAMAALLAEAADVRATLDFAGAWGRRAQALIRGETPIAEFVQRNAWAFSAAIIKEPNLTFAAGPLMAHFPQARAIFLVREPCANIRSILSRLRLPGDREQLSSREWRRISPNWRMILRGEDIGVAGRNYVETLAFRWLKAADIYGALKARLRLVRYEDFNADKTGTIAALAREFALPLKRDITPSLDRRFQPRAPAQWTPQEFFGPHNLDRILRTCGMRAADFGYRSP